MTDTRSGDDRRDVDHFAIAQDLARKAEKHLDACQENPLTVRYATLAQVHATLALVKAQEDIGRSSRRWHPA